MTDPTVPERLTPLPFLGFIRFEGTDAADFLQGQLTNDVRLLTDGRTQFAALCTPQGRVVALLRLREHEGAIYALVPADLVDKVMALLRRYVLRAKVRIQPATDFFAAWDRAPASADAAAPSTVKFDYAAGRTVVAIPGADEACVVAASDTDAVVVERDWVAADIAAGLPQVVPETSEVFTPQMLNLDLLDGVSFSKGCYTGQEIVTRTQHLGRIKRRTFRYRLPAGPAPAPLDALYRDGSKAAEVIMSAAHRTHVELLAVTSLGMRGSSLCTMDGRAAEPLDLPYTLESSS